MWTLVSAKKHVATGQNYLSQMLNFTLTPPLPLHYPSITPPPAHRTVENCHSFNLISHLPLHYRSIPLHYPPLPLHYPSITPPPAHRTVSKIKLQNLKFNVLMFFLSLCFGLRPYLIQYISHRPDFFVSNFLQII